MPYSVPKGYFEQLSWPIETKEIKPVAKVVSFARQKWFRYAAAAIVIGIVSVGGFLLFNKNGSIDPKTQSTEWVVKNTKTISTDEINSFVQLAERDVAKVDSKAEVKDKNDVRNLIKDIPDKDIQRFLDDTQESESNNNVDEITN